MIYKTKVTVCSELFKLQTDEFKCHGIFKFLRGCRGWGGGASLCSVNRLKSQPYVYFSGTTERLLTP